MLFANWSAAIYMLLICAYFFSEILDLHDLIFMFEDLYILRHHGKWKYQYNGFHCTISNYVKFLCIYLKGLFTQCNVSGKNYRLRTINNGLFIERKTKPTYICKRHDCTWNELTYTNINLFWELKRCSRLLLLIWKKINLYNF